MNTAQALHSAARRYCIDNHRHWTHVYATIPNHGRASDGYHYSSKALDTFPRYNMLSAIHVAVETIDSGSLDDFAMAKALVVNAGWMANDDSTRDPGETAVNAQNTERENFCDFVNSLSELDVWENEPLPYRRVLSIAESDHIWSLLGS